MNLSLRQLGFLLAAGVVCLTARSAEAGFVSSADDSVLSKVAVSWDQPTSSSMKTPESPRPAPQTPKPLRWLDEPLMAAFSGSQSSGGMSSVPSSVSSGGQSPFLTTSTPELSAPALVSRLVVRDEELVPQVTLSGIFRPPCA